MLDSCYIGVEFIVPMPSSFVTHKTGIQIRSQALELRIFFSILGVAIPGSYYGLSYVALKRCSEYQWL